MRGVGTYIVLIVLAILVGAGTFLLLTYKAFVLDAFVWAPGAHAHTHDWAQLSPSVRKWFQNQRVPGGPEAGRSCCNESDGAYAEEDIREGNYWTRCNDDKSTCPIKEWTPVPAEVVIHDPNRNGAPVVWWYTKWEPDGRRKVLIRCYAPGGGV